MIKKYFSKYLIFSSEFTHLSSQQTENIANIKFVLLQISNIKLGGEMRVFSIIILISFIAMSLNSATWERTFGGSGTDVGYSVIQDSEGFYIVAGYTESFGAGGKDIYILKVDSVGDTVWTKTYGGSGDDVAYDLHETNDSCYVLCGYQNDSSLYIFKINQAGYIIWEKTYPSFNTSRSFNITFDNGFILASDSYILKLDSSGDSLWSYYVDGNYEVKSVIQTHDSGYILTANIDVYTLTRIIKFDKNISVEWDTIYSSYSFWHTAKIIQISEYEYIFITMEEYVTIGDFACLVKIDSVGNIIWGTDQFSDIYSYSGFEDFCLTSDSNYITAGYCYSLWDPNKCFINKYLSNGTFIYNVVFNDTSLFYSIYLTEDSGFIITGMNNFNLYLVKTDSLGEVGIEEEIPGDISSSDILNIIDIGNGQVNFNFILPNSSNIKLDIFDISGRLINTPISGYYLKGEYEINCEFERRGVYFYQIESEFLNETGKFTILR